MGMIMTALAAATLSASPSPPTPPTPPPQRLSQSEIDAVLDRAADRPVIDQPVPPPPPPAPRQIHGEMGVAIGTNGYRAAFGTAAVPLPGDGVAILSFESSTMREDRRGPR